MPLPWEVDPFLDAALAGTRLAKSPSLGLPWLNKPPAPLGTLPSPFGQEEDQGPAPQSGVKLEPTTTPEWLAANEPPPEEPGFLEKLGYALDTPDAYFRGLLAGRPGERKSGQDIFEAWGLKSTEEDDPLFSPWGVAGLLTEMVAAPTNLLGGFGALSKSGKAAVTATKGLKATRDVAAALRDTRKYIKAAEAAGDIEKAALLAERAGQMQKGLKQTGHAIAAGVDPLAESIGLLRETGAPYQLADDWATAARQGQRRALSVGGTFEPIPFMKPWFELPEATIAAGAPVLKGLQSTGNFLSALPPVKVAGQLFGKAREAGGALWEEMQSAKNRIFKDTAEAADEAVALRGALGKIDPNELPPDLPQGPPPGPGLGPITPPPGGAGPGGAFFDPETGEALDPLLVHAFQGQALPTELDPAFKGTIFEGVEGGPGAPLDLPTLARHPAEPGLLREAPPVEPVALQEPFHPATLDRPVIEPPPKVEEVPFVPPPRVNPYEDAARVPLLPKKGDAISYVPKGFKKPQDTKVLDILPDGRLLIEYGRAVKVPGSKFPKITPVTETIEASESLLKGSTKAARERAIELAQFEPEQRRALRGASRDANVALDALNERQLAEVEAMANDPLRGAKDRSYEANRLRMEQIGGYTPPDAIGTGPVAKAKALPAILEDLLPQVERGEIPMPGLKSIETMPNPGTGGKFQLAGHPYEIVEELPGGKVRAKDGPGMPEAVFPDSLVPHDRGTGVQPGGAARISRVPAESGLPDAEILEAAGKQDLERRAKNLRQMAGLGDPQAAERLKQVEAQLAPKAGPPAPKVPRKLSMSDSQAVRVQEGLQEFDAARALPEQAAHMQALKAEVRQPPELPKAPASLAEQASRKWIAFAEKQAEELGGNSQTIRQMGGSGQIGQMARDLERRPWTINTKIKNKFALSELKKADAVEVRWDKAGEPYYALKGETPPPGLMDRAEAEAFFKEAEAPKPKPPSVAGAAPAAQMARPAYSSAQWYKDLKTKFRLPEGQAKAAQAVTDALAETWAKETGRTADEWYAARIASVEKGDLMPDVQTLLQVQGVTRKGAARFAEDGKAIIYAFKRADVSTALHEVGHVLRKHLEGDELKVFEDWAGVKGGEWATEHEEKFAQAWEKYLRTGQAPTTGLEGVFQKLKGWLTSIYTKIRGGKVEGIELGAEQRAVFDRMLGGGKAAAQEVQQAGIRPGDTVKALTLPGEVKVIRAGAKALEVKDTQGVIHKVPRSSVTPVGVKSSGKVVENIPGKYNQPKAETKVAEGQNLKPFLDRPPEGGWSAADEVPAQYQKAPQAPKPAPNKAPPPPAKNEIPVGSAGVHDEELRQAMGVSREALESYSPEAAVGRFGRSWHYTSIEGTPTGSFGTRREALEAAKKHLALKTDMYLNPAGYRDVRAVRAEKQLGLIEKYQKQGLTEVEAGARARAELPDVEILEQAGRPQVQKLQAELNQLLERRDAIRQKQMARYDDRSATRRKTTTSNAEADLLNERIEWLRGEIKKGTPATEAKVVNETDLLGQQRARVEGAGGQVEQGQMFDNEVSPELARERRQAEAHRKAGGELLFDDVAMAEAKAPATETPAFRKWFGASKMVDEAGAPQAFYHGSTKAGFEAFDAAKDSGRNLAGPGFYFSTDPEIAAAHALRQGAEAPGTYKTYLKVENPLDFDKAVTGNQMLGILEAGQRLAPDADWIGLEHGNGQNVWKQVAGRVGRQKANEVLKEAGIDGIRYQDGKVVVAFEPNQIKSATGNRGTFDAGNPNILFQDEPAQSAFGQPAPRGKPKYQMPEGEAAILKAQRDDVIARALDLEAEARKYEGPQAERLYAQADELKKKARYFDDWMKTGKAPPWSPEATAAEKARVAERLRFIEKASAGAVQHGEVRKYLERTGFKISAAGVEAARMLPPDAAPEIKRAITDAGELKGAKAAAKGKVAEIAEALDQEYKALHAADQSLTIPTGALNDPRVEYRPRIPTKYGKGYFQRLDAKQRGQLFVDLEKLRTAKGIPFDEGRLAPVLEQRLKAGMKGQLGRNEPVPAVLRGFAQKTLEALDPETRAFIEKNGLVEEFLAHESMLQNTHGSQYQRLAAHKGLAISELNDAFKKHGAKEAVFSEDPAVQLFTRKARSIRAQAADDYFKRIAERLGTEVKDEPGKIAWHKPVPGADGIEFYGKGQGYGIESVNRLRGEAGLPHVTFPNIETAKQVQRSLAKLTDIEEVGPVLRWYDNATKVIKSWVYRPWPASRLRDRISNRLQGWLVDVPVVGNHYTVAHRVAAGLDVSVKLKNGELLDRAKLIDELRRNNVVGGGMYEVEFGKKMLEGGESWNPLDPDNKWIKAGERVSGFLQNAPGQLASGAGLSTAARMDARGGEAIDRIGVYVYKRRNGLSEADAAADVKKALFDYSDMNEFEEKVMNRGVLFYAYTRNVLPFMLDRMLGRPGKVAAMARLATGPNGRREGLPEHMPGFMAEGLPLPMGEDEEGNPQVLWGLGTPLEAAAEPFSGFAEGPARGLEKSLANLNPLLRVPFEVASGRRFFFGRGIEEMRKAPHFVEALPEAAQDAIGVKRFTDSKGREKFEMDPYMLYALETSPAGRALSQASKAADPRKGLGAKALNLLTGAKVTSVDEEEAAYWARKDFLEEEARRLERAGELRRRDLYYVPKGQKGKSAEADAVVKAMRK